MEDSKNFFESLRNSYGWRGTITGFRWIEASIVFVITMLVFANTLCRYIFNINLAWIEEILLITAMWMYFIGGMLGAEEQSHISGDLITGSLRNRTVKKWLLFFVNLINTLICAYFAYLAVKYCIQQTKFGVTTAVLRWPKGTSQYAVAFGLCGMCFFWLIHMLRYLFEKPERIPLSEDMQMAEDVQETPAQNAGAGEPEAEDSQEEKE